MTFSPGFLESLEKAVTGNGHEMRAEEDKGIVWVHVDGYSVIQVTDMVENLAVVRIMLGDLGEPNEESFYKYARICRVLDFVSIGLLEDRFIFYSVPVQGYGRFAEVLEECCTVCDYFVAAVEELKSGS